MKTILLILAASLAAFGQNATFFAMSTQTSVSSDKLTLQQNATQPIYAQMVRAVINSTVNGTVVIERSATAPTTTATTIVQTNGAAGYSRLSAFAASDVGTGTAISVTYTLTANTPLVLDMTPVALGSVGSNQNVTVNVALGSSGNVQTALYWQESKN